jgi:hypothetical protein
MSRQKSSRDFHSRLSQCLTLAPVVALQSEIASAEDKKCLSKVLFYLRQESTGSVEEDVRKLASLIQKYARPYPSPLRSQLHTSSCFSLVADLGLKSTLAHYKVPRSDIVQIAALALGRHNDPNLGKVISLLESLY